MTHPSVHVQIAPTSVPSMPSWLGEVAVLAHVFSQLGLQKAIEERVRFARARLGERTCLIRQRFPAFWQPLIKGPLKRSARSFKKTWWHDLCSPPRQAGYGTGKASIGSW